MFFCTKIYFLRNIEPGGTMQPFRGEAGACHGEKVCTPRNDAVGVGKQEHTRLRNVFPRCQIKHTRRSSSENRIMPSWILCTVFAEGRLLPVA